MTSTTARNMGAVLDRIAAATSVIRVREEDLRRSDVNGGTKEELAARMEVAVEQLEKAAKKLTEVLG